MSRSRNVVCKYGRCLSKQDVDGYCTDNDDCKVKVELQSYVLEIEKTVIVLEVKKESMWCDKLCRGDGAEMYLLNTFRCPGQAVGERCEDDANCQKEMSWNFWFKSLL